MGKLTSLLKKKKSKGDSLSGNGTGSTMTGSSISVETGGIPAATVAFVSVAPLSLSIPTTEMAASDLQLPFSLMDDIMDELAGTTPDTPQPSKPTDLSDFGIAFELSRQLELGESEATVPTVRNGAPGGGNQKIGKLDQNSAFKDNAFLQQARSGAPIPPAGAAPYRSTYSNTNSNTSNSSSASGNHNSSTTGFNAATVTSITTTSTTTIAATPSYLRGRFQTKEAEELTVEAAAKLREASKKANAQLPSDDEGSDASDSDDSQYEPGFKKQQRLLQQQQYQHQLFLEQQQLLQQQLAGNSGAGLKGPEAQGLEEEERKPVVINHEAVIDRMKDRHRALLQGAAAAAREEYYEDYRDEYGMIPQQMQSPPAVMNYNMQYGMDPSMMYADDCRIQQQQQQMYFAQGGMPAHPHTHINATTYNHHSMNGMIPGYGYAHPPAPMPSYTSGMQTPVYQQQQQQLLQQGGSGRGTPMSHVPAGILQGRSDSVVSDGSAPNSNSRRGSVQYSVVSSARVSEDSWNDTQQSQQQHPLHHGHQYQHSMSALSVLSTQKSANSDSGYSGVASDQGKNTFDDSLDDIQTAVGFEYEKTRAKLDDVTKVIEVLSIAQAAEKDSDGDDEDNDSNLDSDSDSDDSDDDEKSQGSDLEEQDEDPESLKGSTIIDSIRHGFKGIATGSSTAPSNNGSNENENENDNEDDSSDDDQPIILSRRNSARGPFNLTKVSAEEAAMMSQAQGMISSPQQQQHQQQQQVPVPTNNAQMQYMAAAHTMGMYQQPIQGQMHMSYMLQQQQPPQPVMSPPPQHQQSHQQQQSYVPMGYQFPGPQGVPSNMGHHHSYSVDRAPPNMMAAGSVARRVVGPGASSKGHTSTGSSGSAIQSQYPMPATTLLHPLPRRSQSVRVRPQATSPINNSNPTAGQGNGAAGAAGRGRSSLDFVRLPSSGYQSLIGGPMSGPEFSSGVGVSGSYMRGYGGEPLSPPQQQQQSQQQPLPPHLQQHHQQMQQQMEKQQMQQGYYMGNIMGGPLASPPLPSQYGYMMQPDPYSAHPHQQILQAGRR